MLLVECFKQPSLSYPSSKVDKLSLCTISVISCSSDDIGAFRAFPSIGGSTNTHPSLIFFLCRYAFRSTEKVALQEIGPRFTLKLRCLKKGIPAVFDFGEEPQPLALDEQPPVLAGEKDQEPSETLDELPAEPRKTVPPKHDEIIWAWKVRTTIIYFLSLFSFFLNSRNWKRHEEPFSCSTITGFHCHHVVILFRRKQELHFKIQRLQLCLNQTAF
jgi:hypothetical protein